MMPLFERVLGTLRVDLDGMGDGGAAQQLFRGRRRETSSNVMNSSWPVVRLVVGVKQNRSGSLLTSD